MVVSAADEQKPLTLEQAHELAIRNNPQIVVADLKALVAKRSNTRNEIGLLPDHFGQRGGGRHR